MTTWRQVLGTICIGIAIQVDPVPIPVTQILSDHHDLAIVELDGEANKVHYIRQPFRREPDFGVTSVNYDMDELIARSERPR